MSIENGIIIRPVSIADVQTATGCHSKNDVGGLCTSDAINKWARHKPLRYNTLFMPCGDVILDQRWQNGMDQDGFIGGLESTAVSPTPGALMQLTSTGKILEYRKPLGGFASPYRLADFEGYSQTTKYFLTGDVPMAINLNIDSFLGGTVYMNVTLGAFDPNDSYDAQRAKWIEPEELFSTNQYIGLLFVRENGDSDLSNSYQQGGYDFLLLTTQYVMSHYTAAAAGGTAGASDWDSYCRGLVNVRRIDDYHYSIGFKLPKKSQISGAGGMDGAIGKKITVYPIISSAPFCFDRVGDSSGKIRLFGNGRDSYKGEQFTLTDDLGVQYTSPSATLSCDVEYRGVTNEMAINNIVANFTYTTPNVPGLTITLKQIGYSAEYYVSDGNLWQPDFSQGWIAINGGITIGTTKPTGQWRSTAGAIFSPNHKGVNMRITVELSYDVTSTNDSGLFQKHETVSVHKEIVIP